MVPAEAAKEGCDLAVVNLERVEVTYDAQQGSGLRATAPAAQPTQQRPTSIAKAARATVRPTFGVFSGCLGAELAQGPTISGPG
jgi:hypothetical protein